MQATCFQEDLFLDSSRLPRRPYCSDDLTRGVQIRSLKQAITKPYLQINPPHLRVWSIFDVDRPAGALAWEDAFLPVPSWVCTNRENGHAHLVWGIRAPVLVDSPDMRQGPMRYLCAIEAGFREKLEADSGYSGLITKNPKHPQWLLTKLLHTPIYDLEDLAEYIDLRKHHTKKKPEEVGLGRNVSLFDKLRKWAYVAVRQYRGSERNYVLWAAETYGKALEYNGDFIQPLLDRECYHIAKSVSKWTWRKDAEALAAFKARQSAKGQKGGKGNTSEAQAAKGAIGMSNRWGNNESKQASARIMAAKRMTVRAIAAELGISKSTIARWVSESV